MIIPFRMKGRLRQRRHFVPESSNDRSLEQLLEYGDTLEADGFVAGVMTAVKRERRTRKVILFIFGLAGALFGLAGAVMLADPISRLFSFSIQLPVMETMQWVLAIVGLVTFYIWFMNEDLGVPN
jgi:hypothetical protein